MASKRKSTEIIKPNSIKKSVTVTPSLSLHTLPHISPVYKTDDFIIAFEEAFKSKTGYDSQCKIIDEPFQCCVFPNFIETNDFLHSLKNELLDLIYNERNNDLYRFSQTSDLKSMNTPYISSLKAFLEIEVLEWLKSLTGIPLEDNIDITSSRYEFTDVLLCHDDELEGRRIAYMLYLVPPWEEKDGGALDLFSVTDDGQPNEIVQSLYPKWNNFVFFEVTPKSFHQVAEVLTEDKFRLSINGWFYGPSVPRPSQPKDAPLALEHPIATSEECLVQKWINPMYLNLEMQLQIRSKFVDDSEIELVGFLQEDLHQQLATEMSSSGITWEMLGPPNKRHYEVASKDSLPSIVKDCLKLFGSEAFFIILSNLTGLKLHPLAVVDEEDDDDEDDEEEDKDEDKTSKNGEPAASSNGASCNIKVTRWRWKSYTLAYDKQEGKRKYSLDAYLFFNCSGWKNEHGGFISYIADSEEEELLTVHPAENSLALVYRDSKTNCFVKYVNKKIESISPKGPFQSIVGTYVE